MPYPPNDGGAIAMFSMLNGLQNNKGVELSLVSLNTKKHRVEINNLPDIFKRIEYTLYFNLNTNISILGIITNLFSSKPYHISRFYNKKFEKELHNFIEKVNPNIIQCEGLAMAVYSKKIKEVFPRTKIILRAHNVEYKIWERLADQLKGIRKYYLREQVKRLKKFELSILNSIDALIPISEIDSDFFKNNGFNKPLMSSPTGLNLQKYGAGYQLPIHINSVFSIGSLDWMPNQEGIRWFLDKVWTLVYENNKSAKFYVAGKNMPDWIESYSSESVIVLGEVPDSVAFMKNYGIMIVPLFSGSGIRIKIIEGMAAAKAIVSTTIGAEGIEYDNKTNIMIANNEQDFANAILQLLSNNTIAENLAINAYKNAKLHYDQDTLTTKIVDFYSKLLI